MQVVHCGKLQDGIPRLIGYGSKTLPPATQNYSVTELEMFGLLINIYSWKNHLHEVEFDVAVDHKAVVQIMKGKNPPATNCIGALIGKLLDIPFNLYYVKGKDLILTDFLSRIRADRSEPSKLIPISFMDMTRCNFPESYNLSYKRCWYAQLQLGVATRSSTRKEGLVLPKVHGHDKPMDPHKKLEHQPLPTPMATPPAAPVQLPPANKTFTPPHVVDRSKLISINKKPSAAYIASSKLKEKSIKIAQQPRANPPKAPRHRKQIKGSSNRTPEARTKNGRFASEPSHAGSCPLGQESRTYGESCIEFHSW